MTRPRDARATAIGWTLALLASLLLWNVPLGAGVLYPFKLLSTWTHEMAHAVTMTVTGAGFQRLEVFRDTSGQAFASSSVLGVGGAAIAAAGYMGAPLWGAIMLLIARDARRARLALAGLALVLSASAALMIANRFGQVAMTAIAVPIAAIAALAPPRWAIGVAQLLAAQACVNAVLDIRVLFRPTQVVDGVPLARSDAHEMADLTFGTTADWAVWLWAGVWLAWSLLLLYVALRRIQHVRPPARTSDVSGSPAAPT
jgi:hypothetical protein